MTSEKTRNVYPLILHRRELLKDGAVAAGAVAGLGLGGVAGAVSTKPIPEKLAALVQFEIVDDLDAYVPKALTEAELATLKAAIDQLIPADEIGPSASEAGVFVYIDRSLAKPIADQLPHYQEGLAALDAAAGADGFAGATSEQQLDILTQAEAGEVAEGFFEVLLNHTRQGMFADPMYGGNRDFAGWDLIGYPGLRLVWTPADQDFGAEIEPAHSSAADFGGFPL